MMTVLEKMRRSIVVPVVVLDRVEDAVPTAEALLDGGIEVMEITLRTPLAAEAIAAVAASVPAMTVGAGTVLTLAQCQTAVAHGARFIVSPGLDAAVVTWCIEHGLPVIPGCVTPTEIMAAHELGLSVVKFFPANVYGGLSGIQSLSAPFGDMAFLPTGGVSDENIAAFMATPCIHAVGGSWICPRADITAGNFENITRRCREARAAAKGGSEENI